MGTAYGVEGYLGPTTVAVKQLKANADENEKREFLAEMDIMKQVVTITILMKVLGKKFFQKNINLFEFKLTTYNEYMHMYVVVSGCEEVLKILALFID